MIKVTQIAAVAKIVTSIVVPMGVGAVTKAAITHIQPSAPKIDTRIGKFSYKVGEIFLTSFLSHKAARYVEDAIDEFVDSYETAVGYIPKDQEVDVTYEDLSLDEAITISDGFTDLQKAAMLRLVTEAMQDGEVDELTEINWGNPESARSTFIPKEEDE